MTKKYWPSKGDYKKNYKFYNMKRIKIRSLQVLIGVTPEGVIDNEIFFGSNNSTKYLNFLKNLHQKIVQNNISKPLIIMDNGTIHLTEKVVTFLKERNLTTLNDVRYYRELNFCEMVFKFL
jgi:hypothetical protein